LLYDDGNGGFVNRFGPNGEPWISYRNVNQCGNPGANCDQCQLPEGRVCVDPCPSLWGSASCAVTVQELDGNPLFFPIDDDPELLDDEPEQARIPPDYAAAEWPWESEYLGEATLHNFLITTEIHIQFSYEASRTQRFSFLGDDDLWVFLNGRLIIDLGGWHEPLEGEFSLDADTAARHGLADGEMYEIAVFHAERQPFGSSFLMRLEGFREPCE
jgi:fibro-slime domain-containing protein